MLQRWLQEALALHRAGRLAEAEPLYLQSLAADKDCYPALQLMGLLRLHQGRAAEALPYLERALTLQPAAPELLANYGIALQGVGRYREALAALETVVQLSPNDSRAWSDRVSRSSHSRPRAACLVRHRAHHPSDRSGL